jgi:hypothetical protein
LLGGLFSVEFLLAKCLLILFQALTACPSLFFSGRKNLLQLAQLTVKRLPSPTVYIVARWTVIFSEPQYGHGSSFIDRQILVY